MLSGICSKSQSRPHPRTDSSDILIEEADGAKTVPGAFMAWPLSLGARFRRQSLAPRGATLAGVGGLTAQRGRARGGCHVENARKAPLLVRTGDNGDNLGTERVVERLQGPLLELDVAEIVVHEADEPNVIVDLLNAKRLTGERG
jgi:hypothetical protein